MLEASADGGALKTERKGVSLYDVRVLGRAAHAGLEPERGVNATVELAHQVLAVAALGRPGAGTTVTPTASRHRHHHQHRPGRRLVRRRRPGARPLAEQERVDAAMRALRAGAARCRARGHRRAEPAAAGGRGRRRRCSTGPRALAVRLGLPEPDRGAVGGASDGNFTAGVGTPTLDGLGAVGGGAHADDEHVLVEELPGRTALLAALVADLLAQPANRPRDDWCGADHDEPGEPRSAWEP